MLKRAIVALVFAAGLAPAAAAQAADGLTAEEIVARNVAARGGLEAWRAIHSMRLSGRMDVGQGTLVPFTLQLKRPRKMRLEFLFEGQMVVQAFDGKVGWKQRPYLGRGGYELFTAEELRSAAGQAELDGPLIDHQAKGHKVDFVGREMVEGRQALKLAVTLASGALRHLYLDAESFLETKVDGTRKMRGEERKLETYYRDYRAVRGLLLPYTLETRVEGAPSSHQLLVEQVELNPELPDALFVPPPSSR
jgi:outer membrane lipoprotein-sorting protein